MGQVVFVGAGPGAADLITLRGLAQLQRADVVLCDALTDAALRAWAPQAQWIDVGKRGFAKATAQAAINALLVAMARQHARVVRLKGGDPSVFGRLEEELQALAAAGIDCEVVPGVTAALAAAAQSRRPLTRRGQGRSVSLCTAVTAGASVTAAPSATGSQPACKPEGSEDRTGPGTLAASPAPRADTEVFYMAGRQLAALGRQLRHAGWPADTPTCVVSRAGCADAVCSEHRLDELAAAAVRHAGRPAVVTVGVGAASLVDVTSGVTSGETSDGGSPSPVGVAVHKPQGAPALAPMQASLASPCPPLPSLLSFAT